VRHAILGAGGVGGLVGGALARVGRDVVLLLRAETLARHPARLRVESVALGEFEVEVATASLLDRAVDVLWVAPKATQLEAALALAPADRVGDAAVVPLLNGVDHVAVLRTRYDHVLAAVIYVESERLVSYASRRRLLASLSGPVRVETRSRMNCAGRGSTSRSHPTS
jgi:2-dehydropantoate 2-reductase